MEKDIPKTGDLTVEKLVEALKLSPHPEGGYFRETYRSNEKLENAALPGRYEGGRNISTAILYLITSDAFSAMHRLKTDEILHFYAGAPAVVFMVYPSGEGEKIMLGSDIAAGEAPQVTAPRGAWFGIRVAGGGDYTLLGSTVAPGFDFKDFEMGDREKLTAEYPQHSESIKLFTRL